MSALVAARNQNALERQLVDNGQATLAKPRGNDRSRLTRSEAAAMASAYARRLRPGRAFGRLSLPTLDRGYVMVEGADTASLRKGPGHLSDTSLPGQGGTVAIAAHRTTYLAPFRTTDQLRRGDRLLVNMPYGRFTYRVERTRIVQPTALWVKRRVAYERLVLIACHPLYSASQRIVVFARLTQSAPAAS